MKSLKILAALLCVLLLAMFLASCKGTEVTIGENGNWYLDGEDSGVVANDAVENPQGLDFYPLPDGTYAVSAGKAIYLEEIIIPETYKGKKVTCIGIPQGFDDDMAMWQSCGGFGYASYLKKVILPDTITHIGLGAFGECTLLSEINIPASVASIGSDAFAKCTKLVQKENGVHYVGKWAVDSDADIKAIILRSDTVGVAERAFSGRRNVQSIYIPSSVNYINEKAFYACSLALETVTVESENASYYSKNNCLYNKATDELILANKTVADNSVVNGGNHQVDDTAGDIFD